METTYHKKGIVFRKNGLYEKWLEIALEELGAVGEDRPQILMLEPGEIVDCSELDKRWCKLSEERGYKLSRGIHINTDSALKDWSLTKMASAETMGLAWTTSNEYKLTIESQIVAMAGAEVDVSEALLSLAKTSFPKRILLAREHLEDHPIGGSAEEYWISIFEGAVGIKPEIVSLEDCQNLESTTWLIVDRHAKFCGKSVPSDGVVLEIPTENLCHSLIQYGVSISSDTERLFIDRMKEVLMSSP